MGPSLGNLCLAVDRPSIGDSRPLLGPSRLERDPVTRVFRFMLASLVLVVHVLSAPPLLAAADFAPRQVAAERDDCCSSTPDSDAEAPQGPDDCCPDGCKHCPLSCCGGVPALAGERLADLAQPFTSPAPPEPTCARLAASDPRAIYHPPRA
jgi:hypothetical protein